MNLLQALGQLRDDIKQWVTTNLVALDAKIESKTVPIDNKLDGSSTNPVQNKAISNELNAINTEVATLGRDIATIDSEIAAININIDDIKNSTNDSITDDESGEFNLADPSGNVIFKVDANGAHTTNLTLNGKDVGVAINTAAAYIDELETKVDNVETAVDNLEAGVEAQAAAIGELKNHNHDYNELENAPAITDDESGEVVYADEAGNIIARIDADGVKTTKVSANDVEINGKSVTTIMDERVAAMVDSAPEALNTLNELAGALGDDPNFATTISQQIGEKANQSDLATHTGNTTVHITSAERTAWNARSDFSGDYNDLTNAPNITEDESGEVVYADEAGNVIARIDANGIETTTVCAKDIKINGKSYTLHDHNSAYDVKGAADAVQSNLTTHINKKDNPHGVTLSQLGLTADAIELNYVDGVTSNIQTQLNGKAASSHGTHVTYGTSAAALGTSSAGSATTVSRSDHVHALPALTSCTGTLTVAKGGTGLTSSPSMLVNLGSTSAASVLAASPRPGVTGTLGIANGGTGATTAATARTNLGLNTENWTFTLEDGSTVTKVVYVE